MTNQGPSRSFSGLAPKQADPLVLNVESFGVESSDAIQGPRFSGVAPFIPRLSGELFKSFPVDEIEYVPPTVITVSAFCRTIEGTAELCGFSEFTDPSTPPKKYLVKTTESEWDSFAQEYKPFASCKDLRPDCTAEPVILPGTGNAEVSSGAGIYTITASTMVNGLTVSWSCGSTLGAGVNLYYVMAAGDTANIGGAFFHRGPNTSGTEDVTGSNISGPTGVGQPEAWINAGRHVLVFASDASTDDSDWVQAGPALGSGSQDTWFTQESYDPDTCIRSVENLTFTQLAGTSLGGGGCVGAVQSAPSVVTCMFDFEGEVSPVNCYGSHIEQITALDTPTILTFQGIGCILEGGKYNDYGNGNIYQTLTVEDTEENATLRFEADNPFGEYAQFIAGDCELPGCCASYREERTSGFSFAIGEAQIKVTASGLNPIKNYSAVASLKTRAYGSSDPFSDDSIEFPMDPNSDGVAEITDQAIPYEIGVERILVSVTVVESP